MVSITARWKSGLMLVAKSITVDTICKGKREKGDLSVFRFLQRNIFLAPNKMLMKIGNSFFYIPLSIHNSENQFFELKQADTFSGNQGLINGIWNVLEYEWKVSNDSGLTAPTIVTTPRAKWLQTENVIRR